MIQKQQTGQGEYPGIQNTACLHERFETQVALTPQATALSGRGWNLSYHQLNERANQLAHHLRARGVGPEVMVGVLLPRSQEAMIGILAILKSGGAYLPLDPSYPAERLKFMIEDSRALLVISQTAYMPLISESRVGHVLLDQEAVTLAQAPAENLTPLADAGNLAYMIYTSGSTGKPKGVQIEHLGVGNLVLGQTYLPFGAQEVYLMLSSLGFDFSTLELWSALLHGARLAVYEPPFMSLSELGRTIREQGVTTLMITPGLLNHLVSERLPDLTGLARVLTCGDVPSPKTVKTLMEGVAGCEFINTYGPTENTVLTTSFTLRRADELGATIPIGRPIHGTEAYVMNDAGQRAEVGEVGELWLGGEGVARGYANRPELTAAQFVPHPFESQPGARLYRTGDLAYERPDGNLEFLGRRDFQVKIRGHRIELPEIERALRDHHHVQEAVVLAIAQSEEQEKRLVAFFESRPQTEVSSDDLRTHLAGSLPAYMVPTLFVHVKELPLGSTGKVNRLALKTWPLPLEPGAEEEPGQLSALETQMREIWTEVLGVRPGPESNFFALGGTSLQAALLLSRVATRFGLDLHPGVFFERPTIRSLSALIGELQTGTGTLPAAEGLVRLRQGSGPDSGRPPLILIGDPYLYRLLLPHLKLGEAVYAVDQEVRDVVEMAASMLEVLRRSALRGPYRLCGFSYEGLVAYELARQLREAGEEVTFVGLIDTATPEVDRLSMQPFRSKIGLYLRNLRWFGHPDRRALMVARAANSVRSLFRPKAPPEADPSFEIRNVLTKRYTPQPSAGELTVFRSTAEVTGLYDPLLGWGALTGGQVRAVDIRGSHLDLLFSQEGSQQLGRLLSDQLQELQGLQGA